MNTLNTLLSGALLMGALWLAPVSVSAALPANTAASSSASGPNARTQIDATYRRDRAACLSATSHHERSSCLREAGAVRAEAQGGQRAPTETPEALSRNALQRCVDLSPEHQRICERMVRGEGTRTGSVDGGGMFQMLETEVIAPAEPGR